MGMGDKGKKAVAALSVINAGCAISGFLGTNFPPNERPRKPCTYPTLEKASGNQ